MQARTRTRAHFPAHIHCHPLPPPSCDPIPFNYTPRSHQTGESLRLCVCVCVCVCVGPSVQVHLTPPRALTPSTTRAALSILPLPPCHPSSHSLLPRRQDRSGSLSSTSGSAVFQRAPQRAPAPGGLPGEDDEAGGPGRLVGGPGRTRMRASVGRRVGGARGALRACGESAGEGWAGMAARLSQGPCTPLSGDPAPARPARRDGGVPGLRRRARPRRA